MTAPAAPAEPFGSGDEVVHLARRFADATLPKSEWTHSAHLAMGLWYATRLAHDEALAAMREGILRLNDAHGVVTTPTRGYHETITRLYMRVICRYVANEEEGASDDWAMRVNRLLDRYGARDLPLTYYSRARLNSPEARFGWVEPDLRPARLTRLSPTGAAGAAW